MEPVAHILGETMPGWRGPRPEGTQFQIDRGGATLLHFYRNPTPREVRGARTGKARFGLVPGGPHTLFLLYDLAGLTKEWSDAPFALGLVEPSRRDIPARRSNEGRLLMSMLVDAQTGCLHALRGISMTPGFSDVLDGLIGVQRAALPSFTVQVHDAELRAAYARWPSSAAMIGAAVAVEHGGLPFDAAT